MNATRRPFIWLITLRQINNYLYGFNFREFFRACNVAFNVMK